MAHSIVTSGIAKYIAEKGHSLTVISDATNIAYNVIYNSLGPNATRELRACEYLAICHFLEIDPMKFYNKKAG